MRRTPRLAIALLACAGLTQVLVPAAGAQTAAPGSGDAIQQLGACLSAQKAGDLLLLVDRSGSLKQTDPQAVRVDAATYLLERLADYADQAEVALDVAVAGFDATYERTVDWQRLTPSSLPTFTRGVQEYAARNTGIDTDYTNAMTGVRDELRSRARGAAQSRCQAQVWFSDGRFDIEPRRTPSSRERHGTTKPYAPGVSITDPAGADAAEAKGRQALCREGGVIDQLRSSGALTFAVGLGTTATDFDLMRAVATGASPPGCGRPTSDVVGDFRLARDVDELIFALDAFSEPGTTTIDAETGVCPRTACTTEEHSFVLDASIRTVHILAGASEPGIDVVLKDPTGGPATRFRHVEGEQIPPRQVAGQQVSASWVTDKTLQLDLTRTSESGWEGQWAVVFVDPAGRAQGVRARTQIRISGDLVPALRDPVPTLRSGDEAELLLGLASETTGAAVPPQDLLGTAALSATLLDSAGEERAVVARAAPAALADGTPLSLADVPPGGATLRLLLSVQTRGVPARAGRPAVPGTVLADRQVDVPLTVLPPLNFPSVGDRVDFGRLEGQGPFPAALEVTGPGCVWIGDTAVEAAPDGVSGTRITSPASTPETCVRVAEGETATLPVSLGYDGLGNGTSAGEVSVNLAPADAPDRALQTPVAFVADLRKPADAETKLAVFLAALLLGIGLPVGFLYLAKWWTARIPGQGLAAGQIPVRVEGADVLRDDSPFTFSGLDLAFVSVDEGGVRRLQAGGLDLRTRIGRSPTGSAYSEAQAPTGVVLTPQGEGRLPLAVHNTWAAVLSTPALDDVRVAVLLSANAVSGESFSRIAREVREQLPELVRRARHDAGIVTPPPAPTSGWGAPAPGTPAASSGGWSSGTPSPDPFGGGPSAAPSPGAWDSPPTAPPTWGSPPSP